MKIFLLLSLISLMSFSAFSQPKKLAKKTPDTAKVKEQNPLVFNDTLAQRFDTIKVKYYLDVDSAGYVSVNKGYLLKITTFSNRVQQLKSEESVLYDERWRRVNDLFIMNIREFRW